MERGQLPFRRQCDTGARGRTLSTLALFLVSVVVLSLTSCSSLPKNDGTAHAVKNQAAEYAKEGNLHFQQGNYPEAERYFNLALRTNFSVDYRNGIASSYDSLGRVYLAAGRLDAAQGAFDSALQFVDGRTPEDTLLTLQAQTGKAEILLMQEKYQAALASLKKAEALPVSEQTVQRADLLHDLGAANKGVGDYEVALTYFSRALAIHQKLGLPTLEASDLYMSASVHSKMGNYALAGKQAAEALRLDKLAENSVGIASDLRALGIISEKQHFDRQAYDYFYSSMQVYRTLGDVSNLRDLLERLQKISAVLGRKQEAQSYAKALEGLESNR